MPMVIRDSNNQLRASTVDFGAGLPIDTDPQLKMSMVAASELGGSVLDAQRRFDVATRSGRIIINNQLPTNPGPENYIG